jgi:predicted MFS family arabinose efflux permease
MRFFFNRNVSSLILLSALPAAVAIVGFLYYFSPVYLNRIGSSQSTIGRIYMIYGICLVYIAPFVSKYIDASENKKKYVVVSGILASLGFMTFYVSEGVTAIVLVVLLLGFSSSFAESQRSYLLKLEASRVLGAGKTMGLFNAAARVGQVLGPILFGWLIVATEVKQGISYFGLLFLASTFLFLILSQSDRKMAGM